MGTQGFSPLDLTGSSPDLTLAGLDGRHTGVGDPGLLTDSDSTGGQRAVSPIDNADELGGDQLQYTLGDDPSASDPLMLEYRVPGLVIGQLKFILKMSPGWKVECANDPTKRREHFGPRTRCGIIKRLILTGEWSALAEDDDKKPRRFVSRKKIDDDELEFSCDENGAKFRVRYKGSSLNPGS